jgi:hypothetical protein
MSQFIGRSAELKVLNDAYRVAGSTFIPIYGRRRVGKSELILHFIKDKPSLYFLGKKAPPQLQIQAFMDEAARAFGQPLLSSVVAPDWKKAITTAIDQKRDKAKFVLVFDEFQWTAQASPELPSVLQELLDMNWMARGDIFLILCGSYIGFMEREVLGAQSPLFGRRSAQILLKPFSYREAAMFHPGLSLQERAQVYFICGGIPFYLRFFTEYDSIRVNIEKNLLNEFAALYREPDFLLREELRELEKYYGILISLSSGSLTSRAIARHTGIGERHIYYYLQHLVELGYVSRRYPITGNPPVTRNVRYILEDPLLRFWFRFVYPNAGFISQMGMERSYSELVQSQLDGYFGSCFERVCREALPILYMKEGVNAAYEIGEYWDKKVQIDVVGYRQDERIDLGECKWGQVRSLPSLQKELEEKLRNYPNKTNATIQRRIFTKNEVKSNSRSPEFRYHDLEDLYL